MNWDQIRGQWHRVKGKFREQWGELTDDDLDVIAGRREQLIGLLQQRYGATRDEIEDQIEQFEETLPEV